MQGRLILEIGTFIRKIDLHIHVSLTKLVFENKKISFKAIHETSKTKILKIHQIIKNY